MGQKGKGEEKKENRSPVRLVNTLSLSISLNTTSDGKPFVNLQAKFVTPMHTHIHTQTHTPTHTHTLTCRILMYLSYSLIY